jgi:hypothetical protein
MRRLQSQLPFAALQPGRTTTYYVKLLARRSIRDALPHVYVENDITVDASGTSAS